MKIKIIISALSILAIVLLFAGRFITIGHVEMNNRDADSYSNIALWMGLISGIFMVIIGVYTAIHFNIIASLIPFGVGFSAICYCGYLLWCQSQVLTITCLPLYCTMIKDLAATL